MPASSRRCRRRRRSASSPSSTAAMRADLAAHAKHEIVDRLLGARVVRSLEVAHVVRDAGEALEPGLLVEQVGDRLRRPCPSGPSGRAGRRDRAGRAACPSASRRAPKSPSSMRPSGRCEWRTSKRRSRGGRRPPGPWRGTARPRKPAGHVFVGQAVKAVAAHALIVKRARQRESVVDEGMRAVKRRVETGDLRHAGKCRPGRFDAGEVVRLVQRRERNEAFSRCSSLVVDHAPAPRTSSPPWTTRWPTAAMRALRESCSAITARTMRSAPA